MICFSPFVITCCFWGFNGLQVVRSGLFCHSLVSFPSWWEELWNHLGNINWGLIRSWLSSFLAVFTLGDITAACTVSRQLIKQSQLFGRALLIFVSVLTPAAESADVKDGRKPHEHMCWDYFKGAFFVCIHVLMLTPGVVTYSSTYVCMYMYKCVHLCKWRARTVCACLDKRHLPGTCD